MHKVLTFGQEFVDKTDIILVIPSLSNNRFDKLVLLLSYRLITF